MAAVSIRHLGKDKTSAQGPGSGKPQGRGVNRILGDISLEIGDGELLVLIGPSGCGKTTLLRCIAGLEEPTRGEILIDGQRMNEVPPQERDIAMVFQSYALYPHMTVRENLAFGLRLRKTPPDEIARKVDEAAQMLEIAHLTERYPRELSGGQRQRVAMGRAVVRRPKVFLFDEPLSNLDAALRQQMRLELLRLHRRLGATMVYVTHDQVEAMTLASRIAVLRRGELMQVGTPTELYTKPATTFVARFFGTPEMNLIDGEIRDGWFRASGLELGTEAPGFPAGDAVLGVRAEDLVLVPASGPASGPVIGDGNGGSAPGQARGQVDVIEHLGSEDLVHVRCGDKLLVVRCPVGSSPRPGSAIGLRVQPGRAHLFQRPQGDQDGARLVAPASAA
ncbi:MAG: ABC transporter ATP-binding protein [Polyangia bacterium]